MRTSNGPAAGGTAGRAGGDDRDAVDSHDLTAAGKKTQRIHPGGGWSMTRRTAKTTVVTLAIWGVLPLCVATCLIGVGGLSHD